MIKIAIEDGCVLPAKGNYLFSVSSDNIISTFTLVKIF